MRILKYLFPTREDKIASFDSEIKRKLWVEIYQISSSEGRNKEDCESEANAAVEAYNRKFNQIKINLK